ncbi:hypothetical protein [Bradyrhizobium sp. CCBAU 45384]|uniref:hypothetical protein n=1 Tax=Bradyrhizobium sp. CCBAU 45384 TaxID=858428 RepID=UPI002306514C|nr:hypothetical protein [Bradyrhizobium sp. CCBAU 45384]
METELAGHRFGPANQAAAYIDQSRKSREKCSQGHNYSGQFGHRVSTGQLPRNLDGVLGCVQPLLPQSSLNGVLAGRNAINDRSAFFRKVGRLPLLVRRAY